MGRTGKLRLQIFIFYGSYQNFDEAILVLTRLDRGRKTIIMHNYVNLAMVVGMDNGLWHQWFTMPKKMSLSELVVAFKDVIGRT